MPAELKDIVKHVAQVIKSTDRLVFYRSSP